MPSFVDVQDQANCNVVTLQSGDEGAASPCLHRFHQTCQGVNIRTSEKQTVAARVTSFASGLTFSANPLRPNELFLVEIVRNDNGWSGSLRIGITQDDPGQRKELPRFALPDLVAEGSSWVYTLNRTEVDDELGNKLILPQCKFHKLLRDAPWGRRLNFDALQARHKPASQSRHVYSRKNSYNDEFQARLVDNHHHSGKESPAGNNKLEVVDAGTLEGSRVGVFYSKQGDDLAFLYFVVNGECNGPFLFELQDGPLYVVCDIYGKTTAVKIVPLYEVPKLKSLCRDVIGGAARNINQLPLPPKLHRYLKYQSPTDVGC